MSKAVLNYQIEWKEKLVEVVDLVLDPQNTRLEVENMPQDAVIADLFVNEEAMKILKSIHQFGFFPDEAPVIVREKDKLVVLDGNRRVAALKAMIDPSVVPDQQKVQIEKLMLGIGPIEKILVHIAPNREEALEYLAAKHTRTTRKPWSALRRAYFYYAQKQKGNSITDLIERYPGVNVPRYVKMYEMHHIATALKGLSGDVRGKISSKRDFDISTLERLYSDPYVQARMGIIFNKRTGEVTVPGTKKFDHAYSRIVTDIADRIITSRKRISTVEARKKYIDDVIPEKISSKKQLAAEGFKPIGLTKKKKNRLDVAGIEFQLNYPAVERMFNELKRINISDANGFPNAAHDLLRSFLECSLKAFYEQNNITIKRTSKYVYLDNALREFGANTEVKRLAGDRHTSLTNLVVKIRQTKGPENMRSYTANFMNQLNHSHLFFTNRDTLQDGWETLKPLFMFLLSTTSENDGKK